MKLSRTIIIFILLLVLLVMYTRPSRENDRPRYYGGMGGYGGGAGR